MKVTTVSANIRYSQDTGHGAWKVVELGAEATVGQRENWTEAQAALYRQLGCQLKTLWANVNGKAPICAKDAPESHGEPPQAVERSDMWSAGAPGSLLPGTPDRV